MEGKKAMGSSEVSGGKAAAGGGGKSSSSSSGLFNSVFPPPSLKGGKNSPRKDIFDPPRKNEYADQQWNGHKSTADGFSQGTSYKGNNGNGKERTSVYQDDRSDPCHLSNSLYYGGQDICAQPTNSQSPGSSYNYKNDGEDDSGSSNFASRGNWWQGSLYY